MIGTNPSAMPWVALMTVMPTGMWNRVTAVTAAITREMMAHQWVATLNTPMRTKNTTSGSRPTAAVR